jgi:hypothetical protein
MHAQQSALIPVVHLLEELADHVKGNLGSVCVYADTEKNVGLQNNHQQFLPTH